MALEQESNKRLPAKQHRITFVPHGVPVDCLKCREEMYGDMTWMEMMGRERKRVKTRKMSSRIAKACELCKIGCICCFEVAGE